jgi:hypothetical protein
MSNTLAKPAPWEHRRWRNGICRSRAQLGQAISFFIVAAASGGFLFAFVADDPRLLHFSQSRWMVLIPLFFALFGGAFFVGALLALVRWVRFGRCFVKMHTVPGVIGGRFKGELYLPESFPSETEVRMELFCESTSTIYRSGDDNDSTSIDHPWTKTLCVTANSGLCHDGHCVIPFDFKVPYGLSDATDSKREKKFSVRIAWVLRVFATLKGPDLDVRFHVPVFRTTASDPSVKDDPETAKPLETYLRETGQKRRVRMEFENGATTYICDKKGDQAGLSVVPLLLGFAFTAGGLFASFNALPDLVKDIAQPAQGWGHLARLLPLLGAAMICLLTVVFSLFGLLFLYIGVSGLIARRTWIEHGVLRQRVSFLGLPWWRSWPCSCINEVGIVSTSSSGGKSFCDVGVTRMTTPFFTKFPLCLLFGQLTVATNVSTDREAQALIKQLQKELHLPDERED